MSLPKDPILLLSYVNTQLRNQYQDLDDLCAALSEDKNQIIRTLKEQDYHYDEGLNQFR